MTREELEGMSTEEICDKVVKKHGLRTANILINEASFKMVSAQLNRDTIMSICREASIRVLVGQIGSVKILIKEGLK